MEYRATVETALNLTQNVTTASTGEADESDNGCEHDLRLQSHASAYVQSPDTVPASNLSSSLNLSSVASAFLTTSNFLVVKTEADFELIVDEIWSNMKKNNKRWKRKADLRAGLLAFMQALPGN
jgi:hypothetical protein